MYKLLVTLSAPLGVCLGVGLPCHVYCETDRQFCTYLRGREIEMRHTQTRVYTQVSPSLIDSQNGCSSRGWLGAGVQSRSALWI